MPDRTGESGSLLKVLGGLFKSWAPVQKQGCSKLSNLKSFFGRHQLLCSGKDCICCVLIFASPNGIAFTKQLPPLLGSLSK